jgi:hypothetical protein
MRLTGTVDIQTPSGWKVVTDMEDALRADLVADFDDVEGFPGYQQTMRLSTTIQGRWYLLVGAWDGKEFTDVHAFERDQSVRPSFPVSFVVPPAAVPWKGVAIGLGVGLGLGLIVFLASRRRRR